MFDKSNQGASLGQDTAPQKPATLLQKTAWGIADFPIASYSIIKNMVIMAFLVSILKIPPGIAGTMIFLIIIFDVISDPIVGWLSDRTLSRFGRRLPWGFFGALVLAFGLWGVFSPPESLFGIKAALYSFGFAIVATWGYTMVTVPMNAMLSEITQDRDERSRFTAFRMSFSALGILAAGGIFPLLAGTTRAEHSFAALIFGILFIIMIWMMVAGCLSLPRVLTQDTTPVLKSFTHVIKQRNFMAFVGYYAIQNYATAILTAGIPFATSYLILNQTPSLFSSLASDTGVQTILFSFFVLGVLFSQPLWSLLSQRYGKLRMMLISSLGYCVTLVLFFFLIPATNVTPVFITAIVLGLCNGGFLHMPWAFLPDIVAEIKERTKVEVDGMFNSFWSLGQKLANAFGPLTLGWIIQFNGWVQADPLSQEIPSQPESVLTVLAVTMTLLPALIMLLSVIYLHLILRYKVLKTY